jgi:cytochrome c oxidase accessory protein FixG
MAQAANSLYSAHVKVQPQRISGRFRTIKWGALSALLGIYYLVPWLRWDRGPGAPDQAVLIDMPGRRAYFFWIEIWPQEVYYLAGLLILGAVGLFFVTALLGRVWCGFTCPQTVWTDLFMLVERWVEGDRNRRMRLDNAPMSIDKAMRKIVKHFLWILIALATGGAWAMYFNDAPALFRDLAAFQATTTQMGFIGLFTATTYLLAGWAREQVCIYMCPWPRFQSAMFDEHSLLVTYEAWRGEPRGKLKLSRGGDAKLGDCIDCGLCVHVCPTGIDIRDGQQLACIGCALCVDACNQVMSKIGRAPNLIAYDSLFAQAERASARSPVRRLVRPRTILYGVILVLVGAIMITGLSLRQRYEINLIADRSPLFVRLSDGRIQNGYSLKILNMLREPAVFTLSIEGLDGAQAKFIGKDEKRLAVNPDSVGVARLIVVAPKSALAGDQTMYKIVLTNAQTGTVLTQEAILHGDPR